MSDPTMMIEAIQSAGTEDTFGNSPKNPNRHGRQPVD
jgi:hypothetical protein